MYIDSTVKFLHEAKQILTPDFYEIDAEKAMREISDNLFSNFIDKLKLVESGLGIMTQNLSFATENLKSEAKNLETFVGCVSACYPHDPFWSLFDPCRS